MSLRPILLDSLIVCTVFAAWMAVDVVRSPMLSGWPSSLCCFLALHLFLNLDSMFMETIVGGGREVKKVRQTWALDLPALSGLQLAPPQCGVRTELVNSHLLFRHCRCNRANRRRTTDGYKYTVLFLKRLEMGSIYTSHSGRLEDP